VSTLENRPNTALLVIDVQNRMFRETFRRDAVVANVRQLIDKARSEHVPIVWVQHSDKEIVRGGDDWQIISDLERDDTEPLVEKHFHDSFDGTDLESVLADLRVGRLVVVGAQTDACIRSTLHSAVVRGYDATLVSDAHTTEDQTAWGEPPVNEVITFTNYYWKWHRASGSTTGIVETDAVTFAPAE
jgi:nicotinamidase-related amidase